MEGCEEPIIPTLQKLCIHFITKNSNHFDGLNSIPVELVELIYQHFVFLKKELALPNACLLFMRTGLFGEKFNYDESKFLLQEALEMEMFESTVSYGKPRPPIAKRFNKVLLGYSNLTDDTLSYFLTNYCQAVQSLSLSHNTSFNIKTLEIVSNFSSTLTNLDLSGCWQLSEESLSSLLKTCTLITHLNLSYLHKIKNPDILSSLLHLQSLKLNYCDSVDNYFFNGLNTPKLNQFEFIVPIKGSVIEVKVLRQFLGQFKQLKKLVLGGLPVDDDLIVELFRNNPIEKLYLFQCPVKDLIIKPEHNPHFLHLEIICCNTAQSLILSSIQNVTLKVCKSDNLKHFEMEIGNLTVLGTCKNLPMEAHFEPYTKCLCTFRVK